MKLPTIFIMIASFFPLVMMGIFVPLVPTVSAENYRENHPYDADKGERYSPSNPSNQSHDPKCVVSSEVKCFLGPIERNESCSILSKYDPCAEFDMTFVFSYCNDIDHDQGEITIRENAIEVKLGDKVFYKKDINDGRTLPMGHCHDFKRSMLVDSCTGRRNVPASVKFEGWIDKFDKQTEGNYCYSWSYMKLLLPRATLAPIGMKTPSAEPSSKLTAKASDPTQTPSIADVTTPAPSPSFEPTSKPIMTKTNAPSSSDSREPSTKPTPKPTVMIINEPSFGATREPSLVPTLSKNEKSFDPTNVPSLAPDEVMPNTEQSTTKPTMVKTNNPSFTAPQEPSLRESMIPSVAAQVTEPPTNIVTSEPSSSPVDLPSINPSIGKLLDAPIVRLSTNCLGEEAGSIGSGDFNTPCNLLKPTTDQTSTEQCSRNIKFTFNLENEAEEEVDIMGFVAGKDGSNNELIDLSEPFVISSRGSRVLDYITSTDVCKDQSPIRLTTFMTAVGLKSGESFFKGDDYTFAIRPFKIKMLSPVPCSVGSIECNKYLTKVFDTGGNMRCNVVSTLRYAVEHTGSICVDVESATISMRSRKERELSLVGIKKRFCPDDIVVFVEDYSLDFCLDAGSIIEFQLKINNGLEDTANAEASLSLHMVTPKPSRKISSTPTPTATPFAQPTILATNPHSLNNIPSPNKDAEPIKCKSPPQTLSFSFKRAYCKDSKNFQFERRLSRSKRVKSSKGVPPSESKMSVACVDYNPISNHSRIVISSPSGSDTLFDSIVDVNENFEIKNTSKLRMVNVDVYKKAKSKVKSQSIVIDLSCSANISVDQTFGSLKLLDMGW